MSLAFTSMSVEREKRRQLRIQEDMANAIAALAEQERQQRELDDYIAKSVQVLSGNAQVDDDIVYLDNAAFVSKIRTPPLGGGHDHQHHVVRNSAGVANGG